MKKLIIAVVTCLSFLIFVGCSIGNNNSQSSSDKVPGESVPSVEISKSDMFTTRDLSGSYEVESSTSIVLGSESVTISEEGVYIFSGTLTNGQILVDAVDAKVQIVLDSVTISNNTSATIYVKDAHKVFITLAEGTTNNLSVTGEYVDSDGNGVDAAVFSKSDITFNGTGTLNINALYGHGVCGKDDVVFASGTYDIECEKEGIKANDSVRIASGKYSLDTGKDGINVDYTGTDTDKGFIYIENGTFYIMSLQDGISASSTLLIEEGSFDIYSGGGFVKVLNSITVGEGAGSTVQETDKLEYSMKAIKANDIEINGGNFYLSSYEDTMHANNYLLEINGGTFQIYTGDDAIHSDNRLVINDGNIDIKEGYEGLEGAYIDINGGNINVNVLDDAINVGYSQGMLTITGGYIKVYSQGDGIDSNGSFTMTGGTLVVENDAIYTQGDGSFDIDGTVTYTGGTITDQNGTAIDPSIGPESSSGSSGGIFPGTRPR